MSGFWGCQTATIDWCEPNYGVTYYIAEFWNTISNVAMVLLGAFGIWPHPTVEARFALSYFALFFVGIGSAAFHMTLLYQCQLADELPMM